MTAAEGLNLTLSAGRMRDLTSSSLLTGFIRGTFWRDRGRDDHRLHLLQCLQQEASQGPTFLAVYSRIRSLCALCCTLQCLSLTSTIGTFSLPKALMSHSGNYYILLMYFWVLRIFLYYVPFFNCIICRLR